MDRDELAAWLRLAAAPGVGPLAARQLLAAFGPPDAIFGQSSTALEQVVSQAQARAVLGPAAELATQLDAAWQWLQGQDGNARRHIATLGDPLYPQSLLATDDPPLLLYLLGQVQALPLLQSRGVAMVGSRNPTPQGQANARQFARALAQSGLTVVSGLALGVDGAAHEGALDGAPTGQLATVAVVGTGLDRVYPARHRDLAHRIAQRGVLMSELPLGTPPLSHNFPRRNRVISGLSLGTLVVEAALKSGSLITARMAMEQNRDVFAIPGSIHSPQSRGCHALIRQGAKLVESAQDILEELHLPAHGAQPFEPAPADLTSPEQALLDHLGHDPVSLEALIARTGEDTANLQVQLLELELEGHVARLPGGLFQRQTRA
ncbi:MAG: DNA-protecting protein DprA [Rubrivivax sp.]|nr:MAG: DNA-protecting protein DprA [Rubrivivax sp.]